MGDIDFNKFLDGRFVIGIEPAIKLADHKQGNIRVNGNMTFFGFGVESYEVPWISDMAKVVLRVPYVDLIEGLHSAFPTMPEPKRVINSDPATIVLWKDGTKTVVKCREGEEYNPGFGYALCLMKKLYGNDNTWKKHMHWGEE